MVVIHAEWAAMHFFKLEDEIFWHYTENNKSTRKLAAQIRCVQRKPSTQLNGCTILCCMWSLQIL